MEFIGVPIIGISNIIIYIKYIIKQLNFNGWCPITILLLLQTLVFYHAVELYIINF